MILRSGKNFRHAFIRHLIVVISHFLFLTSLSTPSTATEQKYALKSSICYEQKIQSSINFMQTFFVGEENYFNSLAAYLNKLNKISKNLVKVSEANIPQELVEKVDYQYTKYEIVSKDFSISEYLVAEEKEQQDTLNETLHELSELFDVTITIAEQYVLHGKKNESIEQFVENFHFKSYPNISKVLSDPSNKEFITALIDKTDTFEFKQYKELRKVYGKLFRTFEFENSAIVSRVTYDPYFNEVFSVCEISLLQGFNSNFNMQVPDDLDFILSESRMQEKGIEDIIFGAKLSGIGVIQNIATCEKPSRLYESCTYMTLQYDDKILLLVTNKLNAKGRYRYQVGKTLNFSNCILTEFNDHRGEGGWQVGEYFSSVTSNFKSAVTEGLEAARTSQDLDMGIIDGLFGFASKALQSDLIPKYLDTFVCETNSSNLQTIEE